MTIETPVDLSSQVRPHPRLMVTDTDLNRIREHVAADPVAATLHAELFDAAEELLDEPVVTYEFANGRTLLLAGREVLRRCYVLSLAHRLSHQDSYAQRAYSELEAVANFEDWNPSSFLSTAELLHGFGVSYDWLYHWMNSQQRDVVRDAIIHLGMSAAGEAYKEPDSWSTKKNNWNIVCNTGVVIGSLAIADEAPQIAQDMVNQAFGSLPVALGEYAPDGGYPEGYMYWNYALRYLVPLMASLDTAIGHDGGISELPGIAQTVEYGIHMTSPAGGQFSYYDAKPVRAGGSASVGWLAARFKNPVYAWWAELGAQHVSRDFLPPFHLMWLGRVEPKSPAEAGYPLDRHFEGIDVFISRSSWAESAPYVGFKGGDNQTSHSDLDLGTFVFDALGAHWAVELGGEHYSSVGYWERGEGGRRWQYYRKRTEGQNTLLINPSEHGGQHALATGRILRAGSSPEASFAVADLSEAYAHVGVESWQRGVTLCDSRSRLLIQDELRAGEPVEAWWFMHTGADIEVAEDRLSAELTVDGQRLSARLLDGPPSAVFSVRDAVPLPTSANPEGQTPNEGIRKLTVTGERSTQFRLAVLLEPVPAGGAPAAPPEVANLQDW